VVVAIVMLLHFSRGSSTSQPASPTPAAQAVTQPIPQVVVKKAPATPVAAAAPTPARSPSLAAGSMPAGWYVIAYTFNGAEQAAIRVAAIAKKNPALHPKIVAPGGHSPYLIALGGPMSRPDAVALQRRARESGLPRDTFVRNYKGN
jgi:hypothetical protein